MAFQARLGWRRTGLGATGVTASSAQVKAIAQAIANAEGYQPGSTNIPTSHNNPGDLKNSSGQIIQYATPQDGWNALYDQVNRMVTGTSRYYDPSMTWAQIGALYDQPGASNWATNVASTLGVTPNSTLADYLGGGTSDATAGGSTLLSSTPPTDTSGLDTSSSGSPDQTQAGTFDWSWLVWGGAAAVALYFVTDMMEG